MYLIREINKLRTYVFVLLLVFIAIGCESKGKDNSGPTGSSRPPVGNGPERPEDVPRVLSEFELGIEQAYAAEILVNKKMVVVSERENRKLVIYSLDDGRKLKEFEIAWLPGQMVADQSGSAVYISVSSSEHAPYSNSSGFIYLFNAETQTLTEEFSVGFDPFDLEITSGGILIVSGGSGQWTSIRSFDVISKKELGRATIRNRSPLRLSPDERYLYSSTTDSFPTSLQRYKLSSAGELTLIEGLFPQEENKEFITLGDIWVDPSGDYLITKRGELRSTSTYVKLDQLTDVQIDHVEFDLARRMGFLYLAGGGLQPIHLDAMTSGKIQDHQGSVLDAAFSSNHQFEVTVNGTKSLISKRRHQCPDCASRIAPNAIFSYQPEIVDTTKVVSFDTIGIDESDPRGSLEYRWDFDGDGRWDTKFSRVASITNQFYVAGKYLAFLQVKDSLGFSSVIEQVIDVKQGLDDGVSLSDDPISQIPEDYSDIELDRSRNLVYITIKSEKRLYTLNLNTGKFEHYFEFGHIPEKMKVSSSGDRLFVTLRIGAHRLIWEEIYQSGYYAEIDLRNRQLIRTVKINRDPFDIEPLGEDLVLISPGAGFNSDLFLYGAENGDLLAEHSFVPYGSEIIAQSDESEFLVTNGIDFVKLEAVGASLIERDYMHRISGERFWVSPDRSRLIFEGYGAVINSRNSSLETCLVEDSFRMSHVAFNQDSSEAYLVDHFGNVRCVDIERFGLTGEFHLDLQEELRWTHFDSGIAHVLYVDYLSSNKPALQLKRINYECVPRSSGSEYIPNSCPTDE